MTDSLTVPAPSSAGAIVARTTPWRRRCLWLLPVMLPVALAVQCQETLRDWLRDTDLLEQRLAFDAPAEAGGAQWRVVSLQRVAARPDGSAVALLRLEATVRDADAVTQLPCHVALLGPDGRRWLPSLIAPREASRIMSRDKQDARRCGPAFLSKPPVGTTVAIAESFELPANAFDGADVTVSLPGSRPYFLRFHRG